VSATGNDRGGAFDVGDQLASVEHVVAGAYGYSSVEPLPAGAAAIASSISPEAVSVSLAHPHQARLGLSTILYLLADHVLVDLGGAAITTLPLRLALRGPVDLGEASEHGDLRLESAKSGLFR
jgi:hypothetical protein